MPVFLIPGSHWDVSLGRTTQRAGGGKPTIPSPIHSTMAYGGCRAFWGLSSVKSLCSNPHWDKHYPQVPSDGLLNTSLAAAGSLGTSPCSWGGMGDPTPKEQRCDFTFLLLCLKGQPGSFGGFLPSFHFFFPDLGSWVLPRRIFFFTSGPKWGNS